MLDAPGLETPLPFERSKGEVLSARCQHGLQELEADKEVQHGYVLLQIFGAPQRPVEFK